MGIESTNSIRKVDYLPTDPKEIKKMVAKRLRNKKGWKDTNSKMFGKKKNHEN